MRKILFLIIVGVGTILVATSVPAAKFTYDLNFEYSGATEPAGDPPWLTAMVEDIAPNLVRLTMETPGLTGNEFVSEWYFNLEFEGLVGIFFADPFVDARFETDSLNADGAMGFGFDIIFPFVTATSDDRLEAGDTAVYELSAEAGLTLTASAFNFLNTAGNFFTAAHVQGINDDDSGWLGARESISAIPEPGTILLLGAGLASLFGVRRFKFKKN
jgi:hypothetical protein